MGGTKWLGGILLMVLAAGCGGGQAPGNDVARGGSSTAEMAGESTGEPERTVRTLPCNAWQQRAVDLDIEGPGRPSPEDAVAPFADGPTLVLDENARAATVHVLGADGNLARVFEVSKRREADADARTAGVEPGLPLRAGGVGTGLRHRDRRAVVSRVLDEMPVETIVARVRPDNRASQNVALKAGLRRDATMDCQGEDGLDWAFTSPEIR